MYREFILLIVDYFKTIRCKTFTYEWVIPIVLGVVTFLVTITKYLKIDYLGFVNSSVNLLGVLLGFSIMVITVLTTSNNKNIEKIKKIETEYVLYQKNISLYRLLLINYSYLIIAEALGLTNYFILLIFVNSCSHQIKLILFSVFTSMIIHILLLTIRNVTDFYLIITKEETDDSSVK